MKLNGKIGKPLRFDEDQIIDVLPPYNPRNSAERDGEWNEYFPATIIIGGGARIIITDESYDKHFN